MNFKKKTKPTLRMVIKFLEKFTIQYAMMTPINASEHWFPMLTGMCMTWILNNGGGGEELWLLHKHSKTCGDLLFVLCFMKNFKCQDSWIIFEYFELAVTAHG